MSESAIKHDRLCAVHGYTRVCTCGADPKSFFHVPDPGNRHSETVAAVQALWPYRHKMENVRTIIRDIISHWRKTHRGC